MCGLVGVLGKGIIKSDVKIFQQLLYVDSLRGHHSTGIAWVDYRGKPDHFKKAVDGPDFLQLKPVKNVLDGAMTKCVLMGHNRYATRGGVSSATAHPFEYGDITLCHNGTLRTQVGLPDHTKFSVDSENIAHAFNKVGAADIIPELQGAFALTWYDAAEGTFNIVRNEERTLCIAAHESRNVIYYASERKMLEAILDRNGVENVTYHELQPGKWVKFDIDNGEVKPPVITDIEVYTAPPISYSTQNYVGNYQSGGGSRSVTQTVSEQLFNKWNLRMGDEVEFYVSGVDPYPSTPHIGTMTGAMTVDPFPEIRAYSQQTSALAGFYKGRISGASRVSGVEYLTIKDPRLTEVLLNDANNAGREEEVQDAVERAAGKKE